MLILEMRTLKPEDDIGLHVTNSMSGMSEGMTSKVICQRYNQENVISEKYPKYIPNLKCAYM